MPKDNRIELARRVMRIVRGEVTGPAVSRRDRVAELLAGNVSHLTSSHVLNECGWEDVAEAIGFAYELGRIDGAVAPQKGV